MAIFKCKMCGGSLEISEGASTATCEYCGSTQTLPKLNDDKIARLFDRANHFRRSNEFDKATSLYEQILEENDKDAETYWSLVLCKYGIEYVEDPASKKRIPTVNRAQFTSIFDDENFKQAIEHADEEQKSIYQTEAEAINEIQKGILDISQKEEPFDVFICYKESDEKGERTRDSVLANDIYHQLKNEGFKVFYARITLESKLGVAYEPYIFAALNSAKIMIVLGTKPEYFNAVWVKNEWSRYLSLIKSNPEKMLIPAYSGMDPYDLPAEFSHLQAQDMSKLGFMPDLVRGIKKIIGKKDQETTSSAASKQSVPTMLKRAEIFLNNEDWKNADAKCEDILDIDPENGQAYIYKLMAYLEVSREELIPERSPSLLDDIPAFKNILNFSDIATVERFYGYNNDIKARLEREEQERLEKERIELEERERIKAEQQRQRQENDRDTRLVREWKNQVSAFNFLDKLKGWMYVFVAAFCIFKLSDKYTVSDIDVYYFTDFIVMYLSYWWVFSINIAIDLIKLAYLGIRSSLRGMNKRLLGKTLKGSAYAEFAPPFSYFGTTWQLLLLKCKSPNIILYLVEYILRAVEIVITMLFTLPYVKYILTFFIATPAIFIEEMFSNVSTPKEFFQLMSTIFVTDEFIIFVAVYIAVRILKKILNSIRVNVHKKFFVNNPIEGV